MNQPTHAWLAVEAYRKISKLANTPAGKKKQLPGLEKLLGSNLKDVVVAAWLPDALIKDMSYGHVFKNSVYPGKEKDRFKIDKKDLKEHLSADSVIPKVAFDIVPDKWWAGAYRVKPNGGHLPARVSALCQTVRDMFRLGNNDVVKLTGVKSSGAEIVAKNLLYTPRNIATTLWMLSHYIADSHMLFHCDNRALASTSKQKTHGNVEKIWGKQVSAIFNSTEVLKESASVILKAELPKDSKFANLDFGSDILPLKNNGDPWKEAVYICRASFAASYALVPQHIADVDDQKTEVSLKDILGDGVCGEDLFWELSRAIMIDSVNSIAMFWLDAWSDFVSPKKPDKKKEDE